MLITHFDLKESIMKKFILVLVIAVCASTGFSWVDNFESYPISWTAIPSPWLTGDAPQPLYVQGTIGYGDPYSRGAGGPSGWDIAHQWRSAEPDATVLQAKVINKSDIGYSEAWIHLSGAPSISVDDVNLRLFDDGSGGAASSSIMLVANNYADGSYVEDNRVVVSGLSLDTWYDIRLRIVDGNQAVGEYKEVTSDTWLLVGTVSTYDDFTADYAGMYLRRAGFADDLASLVKPAAWADDFQRYPSSWGPIPAPWEDVANQWVRELTGYNSSYGAGGPGANWEWSHAFRAIDDGVDVLTARLSIGNGDNTYQGSSIGVIGSKSYLASGHFGGDDNVSIRIFGDGTGINSQLRLISEDYDDAGNYQTDERITTPLDPISSAQGWQDDFEAYESSWTAIPAPWETGDGEYGCYVQPNIGYGPSKGVGGPSNWDWGYQYRPSNETVTQLHGRVYAASGQTWSNTYISLIGSKDHTADRVSIGLQSEGEHDITLIVIAATSGDDNRHQIAGLSEDTWYDVRLTPDGNGDWLGEYKEADSSTWLSAGTVTPYSNFDDTYIGIAAQRGGYIDDVQIEPYSGLAQQWYDVKLALADTTATGYYKKTDSDIWTELGTVSLYDGFMDNYVAMSNIRSGVTDDIIVMIRDECAGDNYLSGDLNLDCLCSPADIGPMATDWLTWAYDFDSPYPLPAKNPVVFAPEISAITVDGDLSDWDEASDWLTFGAWYDNGASVGQVVSGLASTTKIKYAWNDAADKLYIGIETDETGVVDINDILFELGGLMGDLSDPSATPNGSFATTQMKIYNLADAPVVHNQVYDKDVSSVNVAASQSGGILTVEIETPIFSDWFNESGSIALSSQQDVYTYANIFAEQTLSGNEGTGSADSQIADGYYIGGIANLPTMQTGGTLVRLITDLPPASAADLDSGRTVIAKQDYNEDMTVDLADFVVLAADWLEDTYVVQMTVPRK